MRTYLDHLNPEYLRYYLAAKLSSGIDDLDLNLRICAWVNADLVWKVVNIEAAAPDSSTRVSMACWQRIRIILSRLPGFSPSKQKSLHTMTTRVRKSDSIDHGAGRQGNQYINDKEPWVPRLANNPSSCRRFAVPGLMLSGYYFVTRNRFCRSYGCLRHSSILTRCSGGMSIPY